MLQNQDNNEKVAKDGLLAKSVWYLLLISRVKHLFVNPNYVKNLR